LHPHPTQKKTKGKKRERGEEEEEEEELPKHSTEGVVEQLTLSLSTLSAKSSSSSFIPSFSSLVPRPLIGRCGEGGHKGACRGEHASKGQS